MSERLAKFIASCGVCSRREAEKLIQSGIIKVDDITVSTPAFNVSERNIIKLHNRIIIKNGTVKLWKYYKPAGLIVTNNDPSGRTTIFDHLSHLGRVISIGRLDLNSEGLLLLTNNGDFARKMELPSSKIRRVYKVRAHSKTIMTNMRKANRMVIDENKTQIAMEEIKQQTIKIDGVIYSVEYIKLLKKGRTNSWFQVEIFEGKNREIRKIFNYFGMQVNRLIRVAYGDYTLGGLNAGEIEEIDLPK